MGNNLGNNQGSNIKKFAVANVVPIMFIVVCAIGVFFSGSPIYIIIKDVVARFDRNAFLVLSLIIPILTGMGLNFGIVLGAMAGQIALVIVCLMGLKGWPALVLAVVMTLPLSLIFGYLTGKLLNKTKGQEMITSMILAFFAAGLYQFLLLFVFGGIIKIDSPKIMLPNGIGVRASIDLTNIKYILDNVWKIDMFLALIVFAGIFIAYYGFKTFIKKDKSTKNYATIIAWAVVAVVSFVLRDLPYFAQYKKIVLIPMLPYLMIIGLCLLIPAVLKTKLGQDMRAVGQDMHVAAVAGIDVDRTRIISICISTVIAAMGQILFLQNLGNFSTYNAHENVGMFSSAALLIGGASVSKATIGQAMLGTVLFHILFNVSPMAGKNIFGSAEVGEYFRVFIAYGIIAITLALHAWKKVMQEKEKNRVK